MLHTYNTYIILLHVFLHVYNVTQPNRSPSLHALTYTWEASADLTANERVGHMHVWPISCNTGLVCTLVYPKQNYTVPIVSILYTVHSITTVLLNRTKSVKIGMKIVTEVIFIIVYLRNKFSRNDPNWNNESRTINTIILRSMLTITIKNDCANPITCNCTTNTSTMYSHL